MHFKNKNKSNDNFILSLDTVNTKPNFSIYSASQGLQTINLFQNDADKYDAAYFVNYLAEADVKANEINILGVCDGPGAFSPLRAGIIIARLLYALNPELKVYKFNKLYLLFRQLKAQKMIPEKQNYIYLKAGLKGYFKEVYDQQFNIIQKAHLIENAEEINQAEISNENTDICLSETIINLLINESCQSFLISHLDDLKPNYIREASVTIKKQVIF